MAGISKHFIQHAGNALSLKFDEPLEPSMNLVITLAPLPHFEQPYCSNPQHGFADNSSVLVGCSRLNTRIRNLGLFMSKSRDFVMTDGHGKSVVVTPAYVFRAGTADRPKLTGSDGVHLAPDDARHLAAFLLVLCYTRLLDITPALKKIKKI